MLTEIKKIPEIEYECVRRKTILKNLDTIAVQIQRPAHVLLKYLSLQLDVKKECNQAKSYYALRTTLRGSILNIVMNRFFIDFVLCVRCSNIQTVLYSGFDRVFKICTICSYTSLSPQVDSNKKFYRYLNRKLPNSAIISLDSIHTIDSCDGACDDASNTITQQVNTFFNKYLLYWPPDYVAYIDRKIPKKSISLSIGLIQMSILTKNINVNTVHNMIDELTVYAKTVNIIASLLTPLLYGDILKNLLLYHNTFSYFCHNKTLAQYYLLKEIEKHILQNITILRAKITEILGYLYELNIIDEQVFRQWYNESLKSVVHPHASAFIEWLSYTKQGTSTKHNTYTENSTYTKYNTH